MKSIKNRLEQLERRRTAFLPDSTEDMNFLSALFGELNDDVLREIAYGEHPERAIQTALNITAAEDWKNRNE